MKKIVLFALAVLFSVSSFTQDDDFQTIGGNGNGFTRVRGFGGPIMSFTQIGDDFAHMMGGGAGIIINNFFFGGYGVGKTNQIPYRNEINNIMEFGHGGIWCGYTAFYNKPIHPVLHAQFGWGAINKRPKNSSLSRSDLDMEQNGDVVFVITPALELEMNFSRFFKLGAGVNYSLVYNTDGPYTASDFFHPGVFASFKFGWF